MLSACAILIAACGSRAEGPSTNSAAGAPTAATSPESAAAASATQPPAVPAPAVTQASWAPDTIEELVAPIALYPDQLLGQILAASVNSQEVLDAGNWLLQNQGLKGDGLDSAAQKAGFGPAMRALVQFPTVVDMMCQQIDWTRQLGAAFTSDQKGVLDAVQRLRKQAAAVGNLKSTPQQTVETHKESDKVIVEVKPATPQVVYVPQYDPQAVYTTPPPPPPQTTTTAQQDTVSTGTAVAAGLLAFGVGVALGNAMHDDDYYYPHWGAGVVYCGPRPFYPPAYVYRPVYGPAFRPAYRYAPPAGYRYGYNNVNVNVNRNIAVNNSNYYNRFTNNQNLRVGQTRSPLAEARVDTAANRVNAAPTARAETARANSWKGQSTYAGARNPQNTDRLKQTASDRAGTPTPNPVRSENQARARDPSSSDALKRQSELRSETIQHVDRGYGGSTREAAREARVDRPTEHSADTTKLASRDMALDGVGRDGGGSFDRAASARGHASLGGRQARAGVHR